MTPEAKARQVIDQKLEQAGWVVQDLKQLNLAAGLGVAVREYPTDTGPADYVLFVDRQASGDGHAVQQINRNIELIRYRRFGSELLLFELANASNAAQNRGGVGKSKVNKGADEPASVAPAKTVGPDKSFAEVAATLSEPLLALQASLEDFVFSLGDDVQRKELRLYMAFKRLKNFATVVAQRNRLLLYLHLDPAQAVVALPEKARDVTQLGHWGTGDLELSLSSLADLDAAKPYIAAAYEGRAANTPRVG